MPPETKIREHDLSHDDLGGVSIDVLTSAVNLRDVIKNAIVQLIETYASSTDSGETALAVDLKKWQHSPMAFVSVEPQISLNWGEGVSDHPCCACPHATSIAALAQI